MILLKPDLISKFNYVQNGQEWPKGLGKEKSGTVTAEDLVGYFRYTERDEAKNNGDKKLEFDAGYFGYTSRDTASIKTFSNKGWLESKEQIDQFREEIYNAFDHSDALAWFPIQSFKDYVTASQYGLFNAEDYAAIISKTLSKFFKKVGLEESNMLWWMDYHSNRNHPHVHLAILEKEQTRTRGMFTQKEIDYFKGQLFNEMKMRERIINQTYQLDLNCLNKNDDTKRLLKDHVFDIIADRSNIELKKMLKKLRMKLPSTGRLQYGSSHMIPFREEIDKVVESLLNHPELKDEYEALVEQWMFLDNEKSNALHTTYTDIYDQETMKLHKQIANAVLGSMKILNDSNRDLASEDEVDQSIKFNSDQGINVSEDERNISDIIESQVILDQEDFAETLPGERDILNKTVAGTFMEWSDEYIKAIAYLYGNKKVKKNLEKAKGLLEIESERGNVLASCDLAKLHTVDIFLDKEKSDAYYQASKKGFEKLLLSADLSPTQMEYINYRLGKFNHFGLGCEIDINEAVSCYEKAGSNKYALYSLGSIFEYKKKEGNHLERALNYYTLSSDLGNPYASYALGKKYDNVKQKEADIYYAAAFSKFSKMLEKKEDDMLSYRVGTMLIEGKGCEPDIELGLEYFERSAQMNNNIAKLRYVRTVENSLCDDEKKQKAKGYKEELINTKHPASLEYFGRQLIVENQDEVQRGINLLLMLPEAEFKGSTHYLLYKGYKSINNDAAAQQHLLKAVQMGHVGSHYEMAQKFEKGNQKSLASFYYQEYLRLELKQSAKQRNAAIWNRLGSIYEYGKGIRVNTDRAMKCYRSGVQKKDQFSSQSLVRFSRLAIKRGNDDEVLNALKILGSKEILQGPECDFWIGRIYLRDIKTYAEGRQLILRASQESNISYITQFAERLEERKNIQDKTQVEYLKDLTKKSVNASLRKVDHEIEKDVEKAQDEYYERSERF